MENIEDILRRFNLSEEERDGVRLEKEEVAKGVLECNMSLIGRVWGDKQANIGGLRSFVNSMWSQAKNLKVMEIGRNLFQFIFEKENDMDAVMSRRPWIYDGQPLVLLRWKEGLEDDVEALHNTLIWVQIWNIPLHWVTKEAGRKIGSIFPKVYEVVVPQSGGKEGKHLKILVEINLSAPLPRGIMVSCNGERRWIAFRYEKCPDSALVVVRLGILNETVGRRG